MTPAELSAQVQVRIGADRLKQLTNYDATATTINTTVLEAACADAMGQFRYMAGLEPDNANYSHVAILIKGAQYYLESYKARDSQQIQFFEKAFTRDCMGLRDKLWASPTSNSTLLQSSEKQNARPDMDRSLKVWTKNQNARRSMTEVEYQE